MHWQSSISLLLFGTWSAVAQETSVFSKASNDSLLWGPYRPNLYFGLRPRLPKSVTTGLLWSRVDDFTRVQQNVRFTCEQHEGMAGYGWNSYDPRTGGVQVVHDKGNGLDLETSFVKFAGGQGGWGARIKGTPRDDYESGEESPVVAREPKMALWFTIGVEGLGSLELQDAEGAEDLGVEGDVVFNGQTNDLGDFKLTISEPDTVSHPFHNHPSYQSKPLDHTLVHSLQVPAEALWQGKGKTVYPLL
jgi:mannosyl-oligosaccharide glucosidase